ncbi:2-(1,2-epoxy-1,2-dihydrophenyl)acetyl-CoA isomerase PaaG [Rhodohalobacter sp.]|uniref:2-(1,2-epoxy-1,2-dihydrophenyl)acetyl-CoA isomerase PaaG n=1 Tax=Rhodohalobacter sp. TaxID=1974210 RepID=UPI002ACEDE0E|nr:2-(1,2-epoxy-1,2-dihydrophenyl)acetyl-CoA isomerase PaaG [Rhodohalobacter sp.]MDZ7756883.1 2-(1,2-epoxy-1,2-dihydrophenyl)acetyl-CoA isomerase PaaG [Rhodohalobacter sp.]
MAPILSSLNQGILTITLNRPEKYNSFTEPMALELQEALQKAEADDVRCVILKAEGKAFCAGQDLPEVVARAKDSSYELADTVRTTYNPIIRAIRKLEKPVVCAVQGTAAGAGANIAFACDIVVAAKSAIFVQAFSKIGLIPDSGGTWFLPRLVGLARTNAMYMLDEKISPEQAVELGLIYKAVDDDNLENEVDSIAQKLSKMPTKGFGIYKRAVNETFSNNLDQQLELEANLQTEAGNTADYKEGVDAFLEKRKPDYRGK